jgi:tetratricopeptide (TPR) repeat protein
LDYNGQAVVARPNDALAQSQLGLTYYLIGNLDLATKHLEQAIEIDPAHFSHPQLVLFRIHLRQGNPYAAADALEDFLTRHPDWPRASNMRSAIVVLRSR